MRGVSRRKPQNVSNTSTRRADLRAIPVKIQAETVKKPWKSAVFRHARHIRPQKTRTKRVKRGEEPGKLREKLGTQAVAIPSNQKLVDWRNSFNCHKRRRV